MPQARDSYFTTYYTFNKIILDIITVKFDIQVDDGTITQSTLLHDDIPGYNLLTLEFVLPQVNDNEIPHTRRRKSGNLCTCRECICTYDQYTRHCNFQINRNPWNIYVTLKTGKFCWSYSPMRPLHATLYLC